MRGRPRRREARGREDGGREACQRRDEGGRWEWIRAKLELRSEDSSRGNRINGEPSSEVRVPQPVGWGGGDDDPDVEADGPVVLNWVEFYCSGCRAAEFQHHRI